MNRKLLTVLLIAVLACTGAFAFDYDDTEGSVGVYVNANFGDATIVSAQHTTSIFFGFPEEELATVVKAGVGIDSAFSKAPGFGLNLDLAGGVSLYPKKNNFARVDATAGVNITGNVLMSAIFKSVEKAFVIEPYIDIAARFLIDDYGIVVGVRNGIQCVDIHGYTLTPYVAFSTSKLSLLNIL